MEYKIAVIVVSRDRDDDLVRLIHILKLQQGSAFELVLVTNTNGSKVKNALGDHAAKLLTCDIANISIMRNLGLQATDADLVAFIDDDAIPEPGWLNDLTAPFSDPSIVSVAGPVMGRSGLDLHYGCTWTDYDGIDVSTTDWPKEVVRFDPTATEFLRVQGTNAAFRREVILSLGGFDEAYSYYLDETDLCMRLAKAGYAASFAPTARVQHLSSPNRTRSKNKTALSFNEIGHSIWHFVRKNCAGSERALQRHFNALERRIIRDLIAGKLEPRDVSRLRQELHSPEPAVHPKLGLQNLENTGQGFFCAKPQELPSVLVIATDKGAAFAWKFAQKQCDAGAVVTFAKISFSASRRKLDARDGIYLQFEGAPRDFVKLQRQGSVNLIVERVLREVQQVRSINDVFLCKPAPKMANRYKMIKL